MQPALTADEIYALAAAEGARPDPLLTSGLTPIEHYPSEPLLSPARGAPTAPRICGRSWTASRLLLRLRLWC
jgi:hypothetical protein